MAPQTQQPQIALTLALAVIASSASPLLLLDGDLKVVAASDSFCGAFRINMSHTVGRSLFDLGEGEWKVPQLRSLLAATLSGAAPIAAYEMELDSPAMGLRLLVLNAQKLDYDTPEQVRLLLAVQDVTEVRASEKQKDDLLRDKAVLLLEVRHRVANSLQIIASVLLQNARNVQSAETRSHLQDAHNRVMSVAALERQLATAPIGDVELRPYLIRLCDSISASMIRDHGQLQLEVVADDGLIASTFSVSFGLIVTELVINALKHAFPDHRDGKIIVGYQVRGQAWTLTVSDNGVGMSIDRGAVTAGLGTSIVEALSRQLKAQVVISDAKPGTLVSIVHPNPSALARGVEPAGDAV